MNLKNTIAPRLPFIGEVSEDEQEFLRIAEINMSPKELRRASLGIMPEELVFVMQGEGFDSEGVARLGILMVRGLIILN